MVVGPPQVPRNEIETGIHFSRWLTPLL